MRTDYLFARPSFLSGVASLFDFAWALNQYIEASTPEEADRIALAVDWGMIGQDLQQAIDQYREMHPELSPVA